MRAICAWCGCGLGDRQPLASEVVTHGICGACSVEQLAQLDAVHFRGARPRSLGRVARALVPLTPPAPAASPYPEPVASPACVLPAGVSPSFSR